MLLQFVAYCLVESEEVWRGDALSIGWVCHHDCLAFVSFKVVEICLFDGDVLGKSRCTHVEGGSVDSLHVDVAAVYLMFKLTFLGVVIVYFVEEVCVKVSPFLEGKFFAEHSWGYVAGYECCLNGYGA